MNRGEQDYIKAIFQLHENSINRNKEEEHVSNNDLAEYLGHTLQTVNETIKKLAQKDLLIYKPYKGCKLTEKGSAEALRLVRVHRLWELFLMEKLHFNWEEVHQEAEHLEHATSISLEEKLYYFLGEPEYCPHGNPIPDLEGNMKNRKLMPLSEGAIGITYILKKVIDSPDLLIYLNSQGITLDDNLIIREKDDYSEILKIMKDDEEIILGYKVAKFLFIEQGYKG
jgi:DtxR family Mn-dependent transcriptional regulator